MKKLNFVAAAVLAASSFAASAASYDLGVISHDLANPTQDSFLVKAGAFADTIDFVVDTFGNVSASGNSISLKLNGVTVAAIPDLKLAVWNTSHSTKFAEFAGDDTTVKFDLAAGIYHIDVTGTALRNASYSVALAVTPVPEPTTYALLLAGLGAVGFVARRRKAA
ncbi:FxDxF family PEP-CTERM protein [Roseateles albus]|uniref:FxDxF family PEP-CTERM protein n=1 Tax=Roseateles albus TaxID=2987525 RepID=A0ABT5KL93_9BURK|nr:FxDxF family PEP-CTERM protein [Roseateles albus]MDC8774167.1 FxDxF family PEP-CTERM protein [Roseateles albus]